MSMKLKTSDEISEYLDNAWLGLGDTKEIKTSDILKPKIEDNNHWGITPLRIMLDPEYLGYAAKILLNIELLPIQCVILQEMWTKPFPMYLATRGFGKAIRLDEVVQTPNGWVRIRDIKVNDIIYTRNGSTTKVTGVYPQGKKQVYRIKLIDGRTLDCCEDHLWVVKHKKKEHIFSTKDLYNRKLKTKSKNSNSCNYAYQIPNCEPLQHSTKDLPLDPYILGCLLGDGSMKGHTPRISTNDTFIIEEFRKAFPEFKIEQDLSTNNYTIVDTNKANIEISSSRAKTFFAKTGNRLTQTIKNLELNVNCKDKFIPEQYKYGSIEQRLEIVRGLMDTDGSINKNGSIEFTNTCEKLVDDLIEILRGLGITCVKSQDNREGQTHILPQGTESKRGHCFRVHINTSKPIFKLPRKLERLKKEETIREKYVSIIEIEKVDEFVEMQCISVDSPDHTYITKDHIVTHNSFLMAVYCLLKMALTPPAKSGGAGVKIVIVGAAWRQARVIFEYMETIWRNSPRLRSLCKGNRQGPKRDIDRCTMTIGENWAIAIPLGNGEKIRGLRATTVLADEFSCLEKNTLVETTNGLIRIGVEDSKDHVLYTGDCYFPYEKPDRYIKTPLTDVYEIKLQNGYVIRCSENHKVMTQNGWKKPLQLTNSDFIESDNKYKFPTVATIDEKTAWLLGILVSEGSVTHKSQLQIKTTSKKLRDYIVENYGFKYNTRLAHINNRGWNCKESYDLYLSDKDLRDKLYKLGLDYVTAHNKKIPDEILKQPRHIVIKFLSGLFEGDGSSFLFSDKYKENKIGVAYYSVSEVLCRDVHVLLDKLGYDGYINNRKSTISNNSQWFVRLNGKSAHSFAKELDIDRFQFSIDNANLPVETLNITWDKDRNKWKTSIKRFGKTIQKRFDDLEDAKNHIEEIRNMPRFRKVVSITKLKEQDNLYDYHLPITHSFYAGGSRQHNSIPPDIYETVVQGFASVSVNPVANVKTQHKIQAMKDMGIEYHEEDNEKTMGNQVIISGTAGYDFQHFADYWKKYKTIINSGGDKEKLKEIYPEGVPEDFNWKDFCIIRIPCELVPKGFMDQKILDRAKATTHTGLYQMEYGAVFTKDSNGFFKRSLIDKCVATDINIDSQYWPSWCPGVFDAMVRGNPDKKYYFGVDPASEVDNFSIVILEQYANHSRVVYCWTTTRKEHARRKKAGFTKDDDFYAFCAAKIRELMSVFPCERIGLDAQGGGIAVLEALHNKNNLKAGEVQIWPIIDDDKPAETDNEPGLHIVELVQFAKYDWISEANHGLRKDMEDKVLLFPRFDPISLEIAAFNDNKRMVEFSKKFPGKELSIFDTLEDCVLEIEELKNELTTIVITKTGTGVNSRDRWDTPEVQTNHGKKGRLRKDRYSALIIANMIARQGRKQLTPLNYESIGGYIENIDVSKKNQDMYAMAPEWMRNSAQSFYGSL